jgi:hypothetical protein
MWQEVFAVVAIALPIAVAAPVHAATLYANIDNFTVAPLSGHGTISFLVPPPALSLACVGCPTEPTSYNYLETGIPAHSTITVTIFDAKCLRYLDA